MAITNYLANFLLNDYFTSAQYPGYLALHVTDPTNAGLADTELSSVSAPAYQRQQVSWTVPSNRTVTNTAIISWVGLPIVSCGFLALWDAQTGGNMLAVFPAIRPFEVTTTGGSIYIPTGGISIALGGSSSDSAQIVTSDPFAIYTEDPLNPGVFSVPGS